MARPSAAGESRATSLGQFVLRDAGVLDDLLADENQDSGNEGQNPHYNCRDGNVEEHGDSNKNEIDREQEHSEILCDIHGFFVSQGYRFCTLKIVVGEMTKSE